MEKRRTVNFARTTGLLAVSVLWALVLALSGMPEAILFTVPVFLLAAPLAVGRYVGERTLAALRRPRSRRFGSEPVQLIPQSVAVRFGRLADGEAPVRGPPALAS